MNLTKALKTWGLNDKEAKVYLALLELGQTTAYKVAEKSELKKPTAYVILDQLIERGITRKILKDKKLFFLAESPRTVWRNLEQEMFWSKEALPELLALEKEEEKKVSVAYYEGINGIKQLFNLVIETMKDKPEEERDYVGFYANETGAGKELIDYYVGFNKLHEELKIKRRAITSFHPRVIEKYLNTKTLEKMLTKTKALNIDKYDSNLIIIIFGDNVIIASEKYLFGTLFKNADMAVVFRQLFDMVWDLVEKDKKNYVGYSNVADENQTNI